MGKVLLMMARNVNMLLKNLSYPMVCRADSSKPGEERWYFNSPGAREYTWSGNGYTGHKAYSLKYSLPANLVCEHCVLRM